MAYKLKTGTTQGYRYFLSEKDEGVPDNFISITEIFTNPKCALPGFGAEQWCIGEKRLQSMRKNCFEKVRDRLRVSRAERFDNYWNGNLDAINQLGLNEFAKFSFFSDLAAVMMAFEDRKETIYMKGSKRKYVSFGIRKDLYRKYYNNMKAALLAGEESKRINLYEPKKRRKNDVFCNTQQTTIVFDGSDGGKPHYVELNKNEIFLAYEKWCKVNGKTKKQGLYEAMLYMMEKYPSQEAGTLQDIKLYKRKGWTDNDIPLEEVIIASNDPNQISKASFDIPCKVMDMAKNIIKRYNADLDNAGKKTLTQSSFFLQAVMFYIKHLPLKYTDPDLYKEYKLAKEAEEYNNSL